MENVYHTLSSVPLRRDSARVIKARATPGLWLPISNTYRLIPLNQIVRLESEGNYTHCHFRDAPPLLISRTLKLLLSRLPDGALVRLHRKHAVNPQYVAEWQPRRGRVHLTTGQTIVIARRRLEAVLSQASTSAE